MLNLQAFPQKFINPKRNVPSIEGGGTIHATSKPKLQFGQLALADQQDARKLIRSGDYKSEADFMKDYVKIYGE